MWSYQSTKICNNEECRCYSIYAVQLFEIINLGPKSSFPFSRREWCGAGPALLRPQLGAARDLPPLPSADECDGGGGGECLDDQRQPRQSQGATDAAAAPIATLCGESHVYLQEIVLTCPEHPGIRDETKKDKNSALKPNV